MILLNNWYQSLLPVLLDCHSPANDAEDNECNMLPLPSASFAKEGLSLSGVVLLVTESLPVCLLILFSRK